jgi:hypothetical protein
MAACPFSIEGEAEARGEERGVERRRHHATACIIMTTRDKEIDGARARSWTTRRRYDAGVRRFQLLGLFLSTTTHTPSCLPFFSKRHDSRFECGIDHYDCSRFRQNTPGRCRPGYDFGRRGKTPSGADNGCFCQFTEIVVAWLYSGRRFAATDKGLRRCVYRYKQVYARAAVLVSIEDIDKAT